MACRAAIVRLDFPLFGHQAGQEVDSRGSNHYVLDTEDKSVLVISGARKIIFAIV